jgi:eukaryotic-like serine/threonine-protein kinase
MSDKTRTRKLSEVVSSRYELQKIIGVGGVSTVYQALDRQLNRTVALKRMNRAPDQKERELIELAWREVITAAGLKHPGIVRVYDCGFDSSGAYIVMELIEGESLEQSLERGPLHITDFYHFVRQSLTALSFAHENGLLHRDIKPGNFMIQGLGSVKGFNTIILDFGLAKYMGAPRPQSTDQLNAVMGSIYYMAPEQFSRKPIDYRTDLYAFGCVCYEVLTGYNVFYGDSVSAIIGAHLHEPPPPIAPLRPEVSADLQAWVMKFLAKKPADRFQSANEALHALPPPSIIPQE